MASEDVIELGSSDDEPEPTANKKKKPFPNAMVHIPRKLHGVTIRPASIKKINLGEPATMVKLPNTVTAVKNKPNGKSVLTVKKSNLIQNPVKVQKSSINPISLMKKLNNSQVMINKVPANILRNPIRIQNPRMSFNPPPITITKVYGNLKRVNNVDVSHLNTKKRKVVNNTAGGVFTVNLDDDEVSTSTSGPQWYLRPEEQDQPNLEESNNEEPKPNNFIEITIEDSPVKPLQNKNNDGNDEGNDESAILVDDSPLKTVPTKRNSVSSDSDQKTRKNQSHSKKKLEYPREIEITSSKEAIEIEIEPVEIDSSHKVVQNEDIIEKNKGDVHIVEIIDSPVKKGHNLELDMSKKDNDSKNIDAGVYIENKNNEFDSVYQNFIDLCFQLENSDDMKKIVEKKIKAYYRQVPKEYIKSEEFIEMVSSKTTAMKADPGKMYLYIKDIVDELNLQRKMAKSQLNDPVVENCDTDIESVVGVKDGEFDIKRHRQIKKLEKTIKKLHRAIQKLEEQEVDFDDEEDSVYLLTERYKERMVRVHAKLCQLTYTKMPSEPRVHIEARPGRPTGPAKRLERWVNKKQPIGTPLPFPDFHDVLRCVREASEEDKLGWNEVDIMEEAQDLFTRCGKKLQRRRQENEWRLAVSRISSDIDPAESSEELRKKLEQNRQMATIRETEILNKYADRQKQLKLEPEEIGDKEAEESPTESEEDEINDNDSSLESKFKRKERLKRLIQEKSRTNTCEGKTEECKNQNENINDTTENLSCGSKAEENLPKEHLQTDVMNVETEVADVNDEKHQQCHENKEQINSISEDSNRIESDIDELHLLNKLYSENEINSSQDSTGSITPIAISDTLDSGSDVEQKEKPLGDVISIENSSYSESETINDSRHNEDLNLIHESVKTTNDGVQVECTGTNVQKSNKLGNQEYVENILLASSCDEESNGAILENSSEFVNLGDENISVAERLVQKNDDKKNNVDDNENNGKNYNCDLINKDSGRNSDKTVMLKNIPKSIDLSDSEKTLVTCVNTLEEKLPVEKIENANNVQAESNSEEVLSSQKNTKRSSEELSEEHLENKEKAIKGKVDVSESIQNDKPFKLGGGTSEMEIDMNNSGKDVEKITNDEPNVNEVDNNQQDQTLEQLLDEMMGTDLS